MRETSLSDCTKAKAGYKLPKCTNISLLPYACIMGVSFLINCINMEYEKRIDSIQGTYLVASGIDFEEILLKEPIKINDSIIIPGDFTTMYGWFSKPCRYVGIFESSDRIKEAVFYLGGGKVDSFSTGGEYYDITYILASDRVGKSYRAGSFRDCFLKRKPNGAFFWK